MLFFPRQISLLIFVLFFNGGLEIKMSKYMVSNKDKIERTDTYLVKLICSNGDVYESLEPRRLFPMSNPENYITLLDGKENEIALVKNISELDAESRKAIEDCFYEYYLIPEITEIIHIDDTSGVLKWNVRTDRGDVKFSVQNRHSDIKVTDRKMIVIRDSNDNRYRIKDISKLDKHSLKKIMYFI